MRFPDPEQYDLLLLRGIRMNFRAELTIMDHLVGEFRSSVSSCDFRRLQHLNVADFTALTCMDWPAVVFKDTQLCAYMYM